MTIKTFIGDRGKKMMIKMMRSILLSNRKGRIIQTNVKIKIIRHLSIGIRKALRVRVEIHVINYIKDLISYLGIPIRLSNKSSTM